MRHLPAEELAKEIKLNEQALQTAMDSMDIPKHLKANIKRILQDRIDEDKALLEELEGRTQVIEL